ncbi:MAG: class I SAM-dependent methyltransferase [Thalassovita sp.]
MKTAPAFWDKAATNYAKSSISDPAAYEYTLGRSESYISKSDRVLELGCGTGMTALRLAPAAHSVLATDVSAGMLEHCQQRAAEASVDNITFKQADFMDPSLQTGEFDVVMAHSLLHLLPDLPAALAAVRAMLKPNGTFISKTVCLGEPGSFKLAVIRKIIPAMQLVGKAPYVNSISVTELEAAMAQAGFKIVESGNFPNKMPPARYLVARKA